MKKEMNARNSPKHILNLALLISGILSAGSGFLLQLNYHIGHGRGCLSNTVWGQPYAFWSLFHKLVSIVFLAAVVFHLVNNATWVKSVLVKKRIGRQKPLVALTVIFAVAAAIGMLAWACSCFEIRFVHRLLIEVHDKATIFLFILLTLHVWKRKRRIWQSLRGCLKTVSLARE